MSGQSVTVRALDCVVYVNGKIFGVVNAGTWNISTGRKAIYTIDRQTPSEQASTRSSVGGSLQVFRKHLDAGIEGVGITPVQAQLSQERYFFLQILDATTDSMLLQIPKCAVGNQSWSVEARNVLRGNFDFSGISYESDF